MIRERERKGEKHQCVWLPLACSQLWTGPATQAHALEWESNLQPFGLQAGAQSTEPHQPGKLKNLKMSLDIS